MYRINKVGDIHKIIIDENKINEYLNKLKSTFNDNYYKFESLCKADSDSSPHYQTIFMGNTVSISVDIFETELIGTILNYQYYEEIFFSDDFRVYNTIKARVDKDFKYRYIIKDYQERLPYTLIKQVKNSGLNHL
jgi:hypothetical protein